MAVKYIGEIAKKVHRVLQQDQLQTDKKYADRNWRGYYKHNGVFYGFHLMHGSLYEGTFEDPQSANVFIENKGKCEPLTIGAQFTGKHFTGLITIEDVDGDDLSVKLELNNSTWIEVWSLKHTRWGFEKGEYFKQKTLIHE